MLVQILYFVKTLALKQRFSRMYVTITTIRIDIIAKRKTESLTKEIF